MRVSCPSCQTPYKIDDKRIPPGGAKLKCAKCQTTFPVSAQAAAPEAAPSDAIPLPGPTNRRGFAVPGGATVANATPAGRRPDEESTRVSSVPTELLGRPSGATRVEDRPLGSQAQDTQASVPLPGPKPRSAPPKGAPLAGAGGLNPNAVPLPGPARGGRSPPDGEATRVQDLPFGASEPAPERSSFGDVGDLGDSGVSGGGLDFGDGDFLGSPQSGAPAPAGRAVERTVADAAVPLPGAPRPAPGSHSAPPGGGSFDLDLSPPEPATSSFDLGELGQPGGASPFGAPGSFELGGPPGDSGASPGDFDLDGLAPPAAPEQASADPSALDFGDLPAPGGAPTRAEAAPSFDLDFDDLPATPPPPGPRSAAAPPELSAPSADDFQVDFGSPPSAAPSAPAQAAEPARPSFDFGEVDLGGPDPEAASPAPPGGGPGAPSADALEFDPTAPAPRREDDLEADLSAPIPAPAAAGSADGLEMLDFIDSAAKGAPPPKPRVTRFHIRRRSGKVFGPFDEGVVVKMLEEGQLLGNEDISTDGDTWAAIGTVATFGAAIQKLMESPSKAIANHVAASDGGRTESAKTLDRLKDLYEGRMAAVAVVDRNASAAAFRRRLPLFVAAGLVVIIGGVGGFLGTTKYGLFGHKALLPAKISSGTPEHAEFQRAQKALLTDTFKSYQEARDAAAGALKVKEFPEARAVWCQAVYYLQRRYAAANPADLALAGASLEGIQLLGKRNAEVVKAMVGQAMVAREADKALSLLEDAFADSKNQNDLELAFLRAEATALKGQHKNAIDSLKKMLEQAKDSAKAFHALGNLYQTSREADLAAKAYQDALAADPDHVASAVELAAIELLIRSNAEKGGKALEQALTEARKPLLGPAELARALALKGELLWMQFKLKEATTEFEGALKLDPASLYARGGLGKVLLAQRQYEAAVPLFKEAVEKAPKDLVYMDGYLTSLIATGKMDDAFKQIELASGQFPGNGRIAYLAGRINDALDSTKEAESNYLRAASADPKLFEARLHLGRLYLRYRRLADAKPQLESALAMAPDDAGVHSGIGELALAEGDLGKAKEEFDLAISKDPNLADAHLGLSKTALATGKLEQAAAEANRALELDPRLKEGRLQRGLVHWKLKQMDQAVAELERAKAEDPGAAKILVTLGAVKLESNDLAGSETNLLAALSKEPSNPDAHFLLARVRNRRLERTQAIESMKTALEHAPKRPEFHHEMGLILRDAKRTSEAIEEWKQVIALDPNHADALEALGQAFLDRGEFDDAIRYLDATLKADPKRIGALALTGDCYYQSARWTEAIARYLRALEADPGLKPVYYKVARAYTEKGKHAEAITWYKKAATAEPEAALPLLHLGYAYKERGQKAPAAAAFRAYLLKKPDAEDKKEVEDEIYDLQH